MAGIGAITLSSAGAVTAPTTEPFEVGTVDTQRVNKHALCSSVTVQFAKEDSGRAATGVLWANGVDPLRHYVDAVLGTGLLAPSTAPTVAAGASASTRLDTDDGGAYVIANGDQVKLVNSSVINQRFFYVNFVTTFTGGSNAEALIDGSTANALANLKKLINQSGVDGVDYVTTSSLLPNYLTAGTLTSTDLTITAKALGTGGNGYACIWSGGAGPRFEVEGSNTAQTVFSGGTDASGTAPEAGKHTYARQYVREDDNAISGASPTATVTTLSAQNVAISAMTASADTSVDYNRWIRSTVGGARLYRGNEVAAATTTDTDAVADATLTAFGASAYDERRYRSYRAGMPPKGRYLAIYRGKVFTGGAVLAANYTAGTASVNSLATAVTVTGGYPRLDWVGRTVQFTTPETYSIMSVSESAGTFEIDRALEGGSNLSAVAYTVRDLRDPYEVFWSETGLPNQWPVQNSLKGVTSADGRGITGLYAAFESLIIFTRQSIWRLTGVDNNSFAIQRVSDKCGCVSGHTVVMDGARMYWLGSDGVYGWAGEGEPHNLSSPSSADGMVRGIDGTIGRLSLTYAHRAVARYDEDDREIHFCLPLDGEQENRYDLVLDLQTGAFALDPREDITCLARFQGSSGDDAHVSGTAHGFVWQDEISNSDGAFGFEPVQTITASTVRTTTVASTPLPTTLAGQPVWFVSADGTLTRNQVASSTTSVTTYMRFMTAPATSTQMVYGGIPMVLQTGRFDLGDRRKKKRLASVWVAFSTLDDGEGFFYSAYGQNDFAIPTKGHTSLDFTSTKGRREFLVRKDELLHGWGFLAIEPGCDPELGGITLMVGQDLDLDL